MNLNQVYQKLGLPPPKYTKYGSYSHFPVLLSPDEIGQMRYKPPRAVHNIYIYFNGEQYQVVTHLKCEFFFF